MDAITDAPLGGLRDGIVVGEGCLGHGLATLVTTAVFLMLFVATGGTFDVADFETTIRHAFGGALLHHTLTNAPGVLIDWD